MATKRDPIRAAVLMGGPSDEHEVSLRSGRQVVEALGQARSVPVVVGRDGRWSFGQGAPAGHEQALVALGEEVDVVFIALHGAYGEDGTVQEILDKAGFSYVGSGASASRLAIDKAKSKDAYRREGLPTPAALSIAAEAPGAARRSILKRVGAELGYPVVVKASTLGSSFGIGFPADETALGVLVDGFVADGHDVLIEALVRGREFTCGILEKKNGAVVEALPVTEIIPGAKYSFFDHEAKYTPGATEEVTPASISQALSTKIQALALRAHKTLGCRDLSRTDFMLDEQEAPWLLETNTIPGLTQTSLFPQAAKAVGLEFPELVDLLVDNAWHRRAGA